MLTSLLLALLSAPQAPYWEQEQADTERSSRVDVPGVKVEPELQWELKVGEVLAGPVNWDDHIFVVRSLVPERKSITGAAPTPTIELLAIQVESGEVAAAKKLKGDGWCWMAARDDLVVIAGADGAERYRFSGKSLSRKGTAKGSWSGGLQTPTAVFLKGADSQYVAVYNRRTFKKNAEFYLGLGELSMHQDELVAMTETSERTCLVGLDLGAAFGDVKVKSEDIPRRMELWCAGGLLRAKVDRSRLTKRYALYDDGKAWYVRFSSKDGMGMFTIDRSGSPTYGVARYGETLAGLGDSGLILQGTDGSFTVAIAKEDLPGGKFRQSVSIARDVLYGPGWAFDLEAKTLLWESSEIETIHPMIPLKDHRFLVQSESGKLQAWGGSVPEDVLAVSASARFGALLPTRPGSGPGLILKDGQRLPGPFKSEEGVFLGMVLDEKVAIHRAEAALHEGDWEFLYSSGRPEAILEAWDRYEAWLVAETLYPALDRFNELKLISDCQRLLDSARDLGVDPSLLTDWSSEFAGRKQSTRESAGYGKDARAKEKKAREQWLQEATEVARWALANDLLGVAATVILGCDRYGTEGFDMTTLAEELLKDVTLPDSMGGDALAYLRWSAGLMLADGRVMQLSDKEQEELDATGWSESVIVQTPNLQVVSRAREASLIGPAISNAELMIPMLERQLGKHSTNPRERLRVFVFENEEAYREFSPKSVGFLMAGHYSAGHRASFFYLPERGDHQTEAQRASRLQAVFVHELVHQFVSERWVGNSSMIVAGPPNEAGYWVVEGLAEFVEEQAPAIMRRLENLDYRFVRSLDLISRVATENPELLFPIRTLLNLPHRQYMRLNDEPLAQVKLRREGGIVAVSQTTLFYDQSAVLVYFLFHRKAGDGSLASRETLFDYIEHYYRQGHDQDGVTPLGFESVDELEKEFLEFLAEVNASY